MTTSKHNSVVDYECLARFFPQTKKCLGKSLTFTGLTEETAVTRPKREQGNIIKTGIAIVFQNDKNLQENLHDVFVERR